MRIGILSAELGREDVHENKRLIREVRLTGNSAVVINYRKAVVVTAKNKRYLYQPDKKGVLHQVKVHAVIPRINEADEQSINLASLALESLISNGVYSTASPASIRLAKNKIGSLLALAQNSVPVPRSAVITGTEPYEVEIDKVLKIVEPVLSKRLIVKTNTGTHGKGVMPAGSRGEARAIVDGFLANNIPVLLQQFIEPTKKGTYTDLRFIVVNGKVAATMKRMSTRKDEIRANISLGGVGLAYKATDTEMELAQKAAKAVGLSVAGVDMIPHGKSRCVIEINASPGFLIEDITGVNVAKKIVKQAVTNTTKRERNSLKIIQRLRADITLTPKLKSHPANPKHRVKPLQKIKAAAGSALNTAS
jgi:ribosomal protein S6--L-glutamate ligase